MTVRANLALPQPRDGAGQRRGRLLAELDDVLRGKLAEVPEAVGERDGLDLGRRVACEQLPPHRPQAAGAQVAVQRPRQFEPK